MVYVLDNTGKAIMPTERHWKVRRLLREGMAHVVRLQPFTIQLNYESKVYTQEISLGVDAGSVYIGLSATTEKKELFAAEVVLRTDIVKRLASRLELRRNRRFRKTRYRKQRFDNRKRNKGWLAPSIRYKVESHLKVIRLVHYILPVSKTIIEVAPFDTQKIKNDSIECVEYQQGEQMGFWNVREYVLARDGHKCQNCYGKSKDSILNVHHIESRKTGGNAPNNLITLCETCHRAYHAGEIELKIKRGTSFRDASAMNIMKKNLFIRAKEEFDFVFQTYGYFTKNTRIKNNIKKNHNSDAFCITNNVKAKRLCWYYKIRCLQRHTRILHVVKPQKKGIRRANTTTHSIGKSRLVKYDTVLWNGVKCFIFGSSNTRLILRDIDGNMATPYSKVNLNSVKFIQRNKGLLFSIINN